MSMRVHAIVVTRQGAHSHAQLLRAIDALGAQTLPPEAVTLVVCGDAGTARESERISTVAETIIQARAGVGFAEAVALALRRVDDDRAVWLLDHGTAPHPEALAALAAALERAPRAALAAPKLVTDDTPAEIVSFGVSMTRLGRTVELSSGEQDQGQRDRDEDTLGADVRGLLLRAAPREKLTPDTGLGVADLGLDLGVRARLAGFRTLLVAAARVTVIGDGPAALPRRESARGYATRRAQLHRRLAYAPSAAVPLHWLSLLPLALWRTVLHLVAKRPASVIPEWAATLRVGGSIPAVLHARRRIRHSTLRDWSSVDSFRMSRDALHRALDDGHGSEGGRSGELRFFSGGGAWAVLAALVVSIAAFTPLLTWSTLGGGGLLPMRTTVEALWQDAIWGIRGVGLGLVGPADPFAGLLAILGTLSPAAPSRALVALWLLALPLAVLGGWFAATRVTDRAGLRILGGVLWALAPGFLAALTEARPAAAIAHLLLPWLALAVTVAPRSWGAAGAAALLLVGVLASAPSLAPALGLLWVLALGYLLLRRRGHGAVRVAWLPVPSLVVFAPLIWWQAQRGELWALLADPGRIWPGPQAAPDAAGRLLLATGFPSPDRAGWTTLIGEHAAWTPLLLAPLALLALAAAMAPRWRAGIAALVVVAAGVASAFAGAGVFVSFAAGTPVALWPGNALSLAWLGLVGGALITCDTAFRPRALRLAAAGIAAVGVLVCALPALTAVPRGESLLTRGPESTLPAYVAADARGEQPRGTLVITPLAADELAVRVVWGASETLGAQTTLVSTATTPVGGDTAGLVGRILSATDVDVSAELADRGIRYVLVAEADDEPPAARETRLDAVGTLNQRAELVAVGDTDKGALWRTDAEPREPALTAAQETTARRTVTLTLLVLLGTLLLALPTKASRRAARAQPRIVGGGEEA